MPSVYIFGFTIPCCDRVTGRCGAATTVEVVEGLGTSAGRAAPDPDANCCGDEGAENPVGSEAEVGDPPPLAPDDATREPGGVTGEVALSDDPSSAGDEDDLVGPEEEGAGESASVTASVPA